MTRQIAATLLLLVVNVSAIVGAPLVAEFALHHGEPGWEGWLYPGMTSGLVIAVSLFIALEWLTRRTVPWWAWAALALAVAFTGWAAIAELVTR